MIVVLIRDCDRSDYSDGQAAKNGRHHLLCAEGGTVPIDVPGVHGRWSFLTRKQYKTERGGTNNESTHLKSVEECKNH